MIGFSKGWGNVIFESRYIILEVRGRVIYVCSTQLLGLIGRNFFFFGQVFVCLEQI